MRSLAPLLAAALLSVATVASAAQVIIDAGAKLDLGNGEIVMDCADLTIAGDLFGGTGQLGVARCPTKPSLATIRSTGKRTSSTSRAAVEISSHQGCASTAVQREADLSTTAIGEAGAWTSSSAPPDSLPPELQP